MVSSKTRIGKTVIVNKNKIKASYSIIKFSVNIIRISVTLTLLILTVNLLINIYEITDAKIESMITFS